MKRFSICCDSTPIEPLRPCKDRRGRGNGTLCSRGCCEEPRIGRNEWEPSLETIWQLVDLVKVPKENMGWRTWCHKREPESMNLLELDIVAGNAASLMLSSPTKLKGACLNSLKIATQNQSFAVRALHRHFPVRRRVNFEHGQQISMRTPPLIHPASRLQ